MMRFLRGRAASPAARPGPDSLTGNKNASEGAGSPPRAATAMRLWIAAVLGVAHTQSFAPHHWWWLQLLSMAGLAALLWNVRSTRTAAATGFAFGLGWFLSGIWWLYISMHVYGGMPAWMTLIAVVLFSAYLSLYPALAAALWQRLAGSIRGSAVLAALAFGAAWGLSEWLRGVVFTGFPWLAGGYAHTDGPFAGYAPLIGVYGIGALSAAAGALIAAAVPALATHRRATAGIALGLVAALTAGGAALAPLSWTRAAGEPITVRLLQGNVEQDMKFEPAGIARSLELYRDMVTAAPADLVVTPETAFPVILQDLPVEIAVALRDFSQQTGTAVLFGAAGADSPVDFTNAVFGIGPGITQLYRYDKHHLVPFGEFIPPGFKWFVDMMKMPLGDFRRGGLAQPAMPVRGVLVAPNICYEDLFGEEIARTLRNQPQPANVLANVTNLAWFGDTIALDQHLQISRMRALETRRPMLRATNTGMTAVVTPQGEVQARLPTFEVGTLAATVQGTEGFTPFVRWGNGPALAAFAVLLGLAAWRGRRT